MLFCGHEDMNKHNSIRMSPYPLSVTKYIIGMIDGPIPSERITIYNCND
jgi:hypothetical protein